MREAALQTRRAVEKGAEGALGTRAEMSLQPVVQTMMRLCALWWRRYSSTADAKCHTKAVNPWKGAQDGADMQHDC